MCKFLLQRLGDYGALVKSFNACYIIQGKYAGLFCEQNVKGGELLFSCGEYYLLNWARNAAS